MKINEFNTCTYLKSIGCLGVTYVQISVSTLQIPIIQGGKEISVVMWIVFKFLSYMLDINYVQDESDN